MNLGLTIFLFILSIVLIVKGGDFFVDAATWIAEVSGIPKLIVGATVVSLATTLPELLVSVFAAAEGKVDMAIGNAVGSVTANTGLIMGIALCFMPSVIKRKDYLLKSILMLSASVIIIIAGQMGGLGVLLSVLLVVIFVIAMYDNIKAAKQSMRPAAVAVSESTELHSDAEAVPRDGKTIAINVIKFIVGAAAMAGGSQLLVNTGSSLATYIGISERVISITLVAIGTSLPELITTVTAIAKKQPSLSAGNIIGANIIDLTLILPLCSLISGKALPITHQIATVDLPACLIVGCIALIPSLITQKFHRAQGILLLVTYAAYLVISCFVIA